MGEEQPLQEISSRLHPHILLPTHPLPVLLWAADSSSSIPTLGLAKKSPHSHDTAKTADPPHWGLFMDHRSIALLLMQKTLFPASCRRSCYLRDEEFSTFFSETGIDGGRGGSSSAAGQALHSWIGLVLSPKHSNWQGGEKAPLLRA